MNILLSGSNGFIGNYLKSYFVRYNNNVVTIGLSDNNDITIDLSKYHCSLEGDFDIIIHCAGIVHSSKHSNSIDNILLIQDLNITLNFLKSISNINYKKFIFLSSVSVYGLDFGENIDMDYIENPKSSYGLSKLLSEKLIKLLIPIEKYLILRLPLVNGINPKGNIKKVIDALDGGYMIIFKNNSSKKSIIELVDLFNFIYHNSLNISGVYIIKSYDIYFNDFIVRLAKKRNKKYITLPLFFLKTLSFFSHLFYLKYLSNKINKVQNSLTFLSTIDI